MLFLKLTQKGSLQCNTGTWLQAELRNAQSMLFTEVTQKGSFSYGRLIHPAADRLHPGGEQSAPPA
jgi:hypothetical protein